MCKLLTGIILMQCLSFAPAKAIDSVSTSIPGQIPKIEEQSPSSKESDERLKQQLKDLVGSVHHFRDTIRSIAYEMTRQTYVSVPEDVVGFMVMPSLPSIAFPGYLPPRKKYMDYFAQQSATLFNMVIEEDSTIPASQPPDSNLQADLTTIKSDIAQLRALIVPMEKALVGPPYDTAAIDQAVIAMSDQVDALCKVLHNVSKLTDKDIKHPDQTEN